MKLSTIFESNKIQFDVRLLVIPQQFGHAWYLAIGFTDDLKKLTTNPQIHGNRYPGSNTSNNDDFGSVVKPKKIFLGQDAKVCARLLGIPISVFADEVNRKTRSKDIINNDKANKYVCKKIISTFFNTKYTPELLERLYSTDQYDFEICVE